LKNTKLKFSSITLFSVVILFNFIFTFCKKESSQNLTRDTSIKESQTNIKMDTLLKLADLPEDAFKLHFDATVIDFHNDYIYQVYNKNASFGQKDNFTQSGLPRLIDGGVDVQIFAVWIAHNEIGYANRFAKKQIERLKSIESEYSDRFEFAKTYDDIIRIQKSGKLCGLIGIEDGTPIENNIDEINTFYDLGVRYIGLTWNHSNKIATSAMDESKTGKGGLTKYGIDVVKRMDEIGMMIDVSHMGENAFWDVINNSKNPIIASHSNCYSLCPFFFPRNLTDEQIKAIAKSGGIIGVNFLDEFIDQNAKANRVKSYYRVYKSELDEIYERDKNDLIKFNVDRDNFMTVHTINGGTSIDDLVNHIDHIKNLVGIDYIGLGSDFDGGITPPIDLYDATCYPLLTKKLAERGYKEEEIRKILGLNFLRVFKKVCG
jgi:membrane dipeptidase